MIAEVRGHRIILRLVQADDAAYIHGLRVNPVYNQHLSTVTGTVQDQRQWIETYKSREAAGLEYYFIIERIDRIPCGVVRLYDIGPECFTWGSWILDHNKPSKAALESALLIYQIGFDTLGLKKAVFDVRKDNTHTVNFHQRFGATEIGSDAMNIYFELDHERFLQGGESYRQAIETNQ